MKNFSPRTILWLVFGLSVFMLWQNWQLAHAPAPVAPAAQTVQVAADGTKTIVPAEKKVQTIVPTGQKVSLTNDVLRIDINTQGGTIDFAQLLQFDAETKENGKVVLLNTLGDEKGNTVYIARSGLTAGEIDHTTNFAASAPSASMADGQDTVSVVLTAESEQAVFKKTYTLKRGSYSVDVAFEVENKSVQAITPRLYLDITRDASQIGSTPFYGSVTGAVVHNETNKYKKITFQEIQENAGIYKDTADNGWIAMVQPYFVSAWALNDKVERIFYTKTSDKTSTNAAYSVGESVALGTIEPAAKKQINAQFYVGPQNQDVLAAVAPGLNLTIDYGWADMIARPLHWLLTYLEKLIGNWGWAIIAMTLLVKLALYPLTAASFKSMAKMKVLAPRLKALQEQYGDDKMKLNQAMMAMYKEEKVNPAGGCLPMLLQMPIFLAFFYVLQSAVEMRGAPWFGWIQDLSSPDKLYILPILMMITMFVQTKLNPKPADPMQAKMMLYMPLFFGFTFFFFPSGLVLYWVVSNIFSIVQQRIMNNKFGIKENLISLKDE
jgi:YidC/Oxa1 family membrane protein insertase